jgi:hypothetical protein
VEATLPQDQVMTLDQAADFLVQPEEQFEEVAETEEEIANPEEDVIVDEEDEGETDDGDDIEDDVDAEDDDDSEDDEDDDDSEDDADTEDSEETDENEQEPDNKLYTVKVDGEELKVSLDELQRGYSGQKFIQKGMQENAELKKQAESAYVALTQERQQLQNLVQQVQAGALTPPKEPDMEAFRDDPFGWHEAQMSYSKKMQEYNAQVAQVTEQLQRQSQADMQLRAQYAQAEAQELVKKLPELKDPVKAKAFSESLTMAAEKLGYSKDEIAQITSHRDMETLYYASLWLKSQGGDSKKIVAEKSKKARKPIKAGVKKTAGKVQQRKSQLAKLRKSGSIDDALSLILDPTLK